MYRRCGSMLWACLLVPLCLSWAQSLPPGVAITDVLIRDIGSGFDWCSQGGIKQDLGAYQNGMSIVQLTRTFASSGNPDFIGWMDELTDTCGISDRPTGNHLLAVNSGGNATFDENGYIWYTYGGRSQDMAFDLFRSARPYDVHRFDLVLDDFVDSRDDGSTAIRVFAAQGKVMLQWRQFGSTVPIVRARHRRYDRSDFSRYESQVDIGAGMPGIGIEQVWSRYDPRFDYLISSFHFFRLYPFLMGSAPYLYSKDWGSSWLVPDGTPCPSLPLDYPTAVALSIIPWDHLAQQCTSSWIEFESGVTPRGVPWMICPVGEEMAGRFFRYDASAWPPWRETLDIGPIAGRLAAFSGGATKSLLVYAFATDARPRDLQAVVSDDDGLTWSPPFLLDRLEEGMEISWVSYCQPSTSYEDDTCRFFYAYNRSRRDSSHNRIKFVRFQAAGRAPSLRLSARRP